MQPKQTFTPLAAEPDTASVYIYRTLSMSNAFYSPDLYVNNEFKLSIKNANKTRMLLKPGKTVFNLAPDEYYTDSSQIELELAAGKTYYLRVSTQLKIANSSDYQPYQRNFNIQPVAETIARNEISDCCTSKNDTLSLPEMEITTTEPDGKESFSVDKTQNPFSH